MENMEEKEVEMWNVKCEMWNVKFRKLRNTRPSGDIWLEITSPQVGFPLENMGARMRDWKCPCGAL
jgi:hypothetical protein